MIVRNEDDTYKGVGCDVCGTMAPSAAEMLESPHGGGLTGRGWYCLGGTHICPDCPHPAIPPKHVFKLAGRHD